MYEAFFGFFFVLVNMLEVLIFCSVPNGKRYKSVWSGTLAGCSVSIEFLFEYKTNLSSLGPGLGVLNFYSVSI